jgi:hypothetical protein
MAFLSPLRKLLRQSGVLRPAASEPQENIPLFYSWILTNSLAIGPMPRLTSHWEQLELAGFSTRFSCCYPEEERICPLPQHWRSVSFALPDHRNQETLSPERLAQALGLAQELLNEHKPVYLHCFAGMERSPLIAVGLTAQERNIDLFAALEWVRRCHPSAIPLYEQLDILDQVLRNKQVE